MTTRSLADTFHALVPEIADKLRATFPETYAQVEEAVPQIKEKIESVLPEITAPRRLNHPDAQDARKFLQPAAYFLIYSATGWVLEVGFQAFRTGKIVNRGFLAGPYCPIYGAGAIGLLAATEKYATDPAKAFVSSAAVGSALELVTGWGMEKIFNQRWWDYSKNWGNIGGYVCPEFSVLWGVLGAVVDRGIQPPVQRFVEKVPTKALAWAVGVGGGAMAVDAAATIQQTLKFTHQLKGLNKAQAGLHVESDAMSNKIGGDVIRLNGTVRRHLEAYPDMRIIGHPLLVSRLRQQVAADQAARKVAADQAARTVAKTSAKAVRAGRRS